MTNYEHLRFNLNKVVNNLNNTTFFTNKNVPIKHKMKHKGNKIYSCYYREFKVLEQQLANEFSQQNFEDLNMYINWLGNNGLSGD